MYVNSRVERSMSTKSRTLSISGTGFLEEDYFRFYHYPDCYLLSTYLATRARCEAGPNPPLHSTASTEMDPSSATHE